MYRKLEAFILLLTYKFFNSSKIVFPGPIFMIQKASHTNSTLAVHLQSGLKGSGTSEYPEICPDFDLKRGHYMKSHVTNSWLQWLHRLHYHTPKVYQNLIQSIPLSSHQGAREQATDMCNYLYWQSNRKWGLSSLQKYFFEYFLTNIIFYPFDKKKSPPSREIF